MSAINFGADHKFYPAGRAPSELDVGFLVMDTNSPMDFVALDNVPTPVSTETRNPTAGLDAGRKDALDTHLKSFLNTHYAIDASIEEQIEAVKLVRSHLNNISSEDLKKMLGTPKAIEFLKRITSERAQRSKMKAWVPFLFKTDPWLVVGSHTFFDSKITVGTSRHTAAPVNITVPIIERVT